MFEFGGSSIIVAFEKGRIEFDHDLVYHSNRSVEVDVEMGMSLGKATSPGGSAATSTGVEPMGHFGQLRHDVPGTGSEADAAGHGGRLYKDVI